MDVSTGSRLRCLTFKNTHVRLYILYRLYRAVIYHQEIPIITSPITINGLLAVPILAAPTLIVGATPASVPKSLDEKQLTIVDRQ